MIHTLQVAGLGFGDARNQLGSIQDWDYDCGRNALIPKAFKVTTEPKDTAIGQDPSANQWPSVDPSMGSNWPLFGTPNLC